MQRWISFSFLAVLTLAASAPLWSSTQFPSSYDGLLHLYRLFALDDSLRQGIVYPRWVPSLAFGYGYPIFNYYPPLAAYVSETLHLLGLGFAEAIKATFIAIFALAAGGIFILGTELFGRERGARAASLLAASAYVFSPYFMYDVYTRGAIAEALALAIFPWLLWSLHRAIRRQDLSSLLLAAFSWGALVVSHSLTTAIVTPFICVFVLFELFHLPATSRIHGLGNAAMPVILGTGLSAFYWLPYVTELSFVRMGRGMDKIQEIFETSFSNPARLIQPALLYHYGQDMVPPLGPVPILIAAFVILLVLLAGKRFKSRGIVIFFGLSALLAAILITDPLREIWLAIPPASLIQSVWRISILIDLALAFVIGALPLVLFTFPRVEHLAAKISAPRQPFEVELVRAALVGLVALVLIWTTGARMAPAGLDLPPDAFTLGHLARFEVFTHSVGTTTFSEYLPVRVQVPDLLEYRAPKLSSSITTAPAIQLQRWDGTRTSFKVSSSEPVSMSIRAFYFPGWRALVDGTPKRAYGSTPLGLVTVDIPPGDHEVTLSLEDTPPRVYGTLLSASAVLVLFVLLLVAMRRREQEAWMPGVLGLGLCFIALAPTALAVATPRPQLQSMHQSIAPGFDLIGLRVAHARFEGDAWHVPEARQVLDIDPYWQVKSANVADGAIVWRLVDGLGKVWAQRAQLPRYGTALTNSWVTNEIVQDEYEIPMTAGVPRGRYMLQASRGPNEPDETVGVIELEQDSAPAPDRPQLAHPVHATLSEQIRLVGFDAPSKLRAGDTLSLTLAWEATRDVYEDFVVSAQVLNDEGKLVAQHDGSPAEGLSPTSLWLPGKIELDRHNLALPPDLRPGNYTLLVVMYRLADMQRLSVTTDTGASTDNAVVLSQIEIK